MDPLFTAVTRSVYMTGVSMTESVRWAVGPAGESGRCAPFARGAS